ncbi:MAG TPA: FeoA family protein, partial [Planctomycetota bacterium]|nr:FeoA family protein [Planctomycetota bacterium]
DPSASPRLAALGFCPGTMLRADRRAPLGDPMIFEVRGTRLALRQRDARCIRVSLVSRPWSRPPRHRSSALRSSLASRSSAAPTRGRRRSSTR